jgi:signal transduction histidine kinase
VHVELALEALERLHPEQASTLHRVTAEALSNVRRHARGATRVDIALALEPGDAGPLALPTLPACCAERTRRS